MGRDRTEYSNKNFVPEELVLLGKTTMAKKDQF